MNDKKQLKLQAFFDGELPEDEAREVASFVARDAEATALVGELRNTRRALKESQPVVRVTESREFYWSKIHREIERITPEAEPERSISWAGWLRRSVSAGAVCAVLALAVWAGLHRGPSSPRFPDAEMTVADSGAFTYRDYASGTTLVWVSYPADR